MKMSVELEKAFNAQITLEFESSLLYRQLAIELDSQDLPGMASWLRRQADEEIVHANKFIDHLVDRDNHAQIGDITIPKVKKEASPAEAFKAAVKHEGKISQSIRDLVRQAEGEGDLDSRPLLNWFLNEQIEEESTVSEILGRLEMTGDDQSGLLRLDDDLANRPLRSTEDNAN